MCNSRMWVQSSFSLSTRYGVRAFHLSIQESKCVCWKVEPRFVELKFSKLWGKDCDDLADS